jgi:hypothetical protein
MWRFLGAALVLASLTPGPSATAQTEPAPWVADGPPGTFQYEFARRLYGDSLPSARDYAKAAMADGDQSAQLAYGGALFLEAVEGLIGDLSRHGFLNHPNANMHAVRRPLPPSATTTPIDYEGFRRVLQDFVDRLATVVPMLATIDDPDARLLLRPHLARIDLDGDGAYGPLERAYPIHNSALQGILRENFERNWPSFERGLAENDPIVLAQLAEYAPIYDFDDADAAWLENHIHRWSAIVEILLAHDWERAFNQSFHALFPDSNLLFAALNEVYGRQREDDEFFRQPRTTAFILDVAAFSTHAPWSVAEPARLRAAHKHLKAMIAANRRSWNLALVETDSSEEWQAPVTAPREWLPAPGQRQFDHEPVTRQMVGSWLRFLDICDQILDGDLLIPHFRFQQGLNLRRMFEEPRPLSPILLLQGADALPYLEDGPIADRALLEELHRPFGLLRIHTYFFWFL